MIRFDKVSFTYQESLQNGGLRDVDLTINKGECVLLCGRSGCGKTTLTRLVNGLIPYFYPGEVTGTTYIDGKDIQDYPMYEVSEHVGSVFQNPRSQFFNVDIQNADQILVLSDGILQGCGKHEELLQTVPLYQTMWEKEKSIKNWKLA